MFHADFMVFMNFCVFIQLLRPIYKRMADNQNAEIFAANTLFVVLGTSVLTARVSSLKRRIRKLFLNDLSCNTSFLWI